MTLLANYPNLPVKHKLRLIIMFTVGAALLLASAAVLICGPRNHNMPGLAWKPE